MLIVGLSILAMASDPRPARPSDEAMLALVAERIPGAVVLQSQARAMPAALDGAHGICGIARIDGGPQPFFVYTVWRPAEAEDGNRWSTALRAPLSSEPTFHNNFERRGVRTACPDLAPPDGVDWPTALPEGAGVVSRSTDVVEAERPPRPSDEAMLARLFATRPNARLVSAEFRETPRGGGRGACGLIDFSGTIEPFHLLAVWQDERRPVVVPSQGLPRPAEPAGWRISDRAPKHIDHDGDGRIGRHDRDRDTADRKLALIFCQDTNPIAAPDNVRWVLEFEPDPDRPPVTLAPGALPRIIRAPRTAG